MKDEKSGLELNDENIQSQDSKVDNNQASSKTVETETNVDLPIIDFENTNLELFELPITIENDKEKYFEPVQGNGLVLTIDEVIQHYTEKAVQKAYELNVFCL